jgi:YVTN family beta-propeller protein
VGSELPDIVLDQAGAFAYLPSTDDNVVEVIDVADRTRAATIPVGAFPVALDLNADGTLLYVVNRGGGDVSVVDVATRTELRRIELPEVSYDRSPTSIAVAADGVAFIGLDQEPFLLRMDLTTEVIALDPDPPLSNHPQNRVVVRSSVDHETVAMLGPAHNDRLISRYDAATSTWLGAPVTTGWLEEPALDSSGDRIAFGNVVVDRSLQPVSTLANPSYWLTVMSPDGTIVYRMYEKQLAEFDALSGQHLRTRTLPGHVPHPYFAPRGGAAAVTSDGDTLVVAGGGGVMLVDLDDL